MNNATKPNTPCPSEDSRARGCDKDAGHSGPCGNDHAVWSPAVEPEQPTSVGNAASDPHLAPYCTNPDCVKIINHDGDCVVEPEQPSGNTGEFVEPCEGCPDPELPCKGCPAVELDQPWPSPDSAGERSRRELFGEPEQPTCCWPARNGMGGHNEGCPVYGVRGGERGADVHVRDTTTNLVTDYGRGYEDGQDAGRARIQRIIEAETEPWHDSHPGWDAVTKILAAIRGGDDA